MRIIRNQHGQDVCGVKFCRGAMCSGGTKKKKSKRRSRKKSKGSKRRATTERFKKADDLGINYTQSDEEIMILGSGANTALSGENISTEALTAYQRLVDEGVSDEERLKLAKESTDKAVLEALAFHNLNDFDYINQMAVLRRLIGNEHTPPRVIEMIYHGCLDDTETMLEIAWTSRSNELLEKLTRHPNKEVQISAISNPSQTKEFLIKKAKSKKVNDRIGVAGNASTPINVLETLRDDENYEVASMAEWTLDQYANEDG